MDKALLQNSSIQEIAIVMGSDTRGRAAVLGPFFIEEIYAPLSADIEGKLNSIALDQLRNALTSKGYKVKHLKTVPINWDFSANISDSRESYANLLRQYGLPPNPDAVGAILFVEYMLRPKNWGADQISMLTLDGFETMYAKSKMRIYDHHTGKRLFFSSIQRGYDQILSHVKPADALAEILATEGLPPASQ